MCGLVSSSFFVVSDCCECFKEFKFNMQIKGTMVAVLLTCTNVYHYTVTGDMMPMQKIAQNHC